MPPSGGFPKFILQASVLFLKVDECLHLADFPKYILQLYSVFSVPQS